MDKLDCYHGSKQSVSTPAWAIRPPGAIAEDDFLGACVRCGLCVKDTDSTVILHSDCTNCGRCIDVCDDRVFKFSTRFGQPGMTV